MRASLEEDLSSETFEATPATTFMPSTSSFPTATNSVTSESICSCSPSDAAGEVGSRPVCVCTAVRRVAYVEFVGRLESPHCSNAVLVVPGPRAASTHHVVVAIDFGTTYSGYAFCYTRDADCNIHMMRKWEGEPRCNVVQREWSAVRRGAGTRQRQCAMRTSIGRGTMGGGNSSVRCPFPRALPAAGRALLRAARTP